MKITRGRISWMIYIIGVLILAGFATEWRVTFFVIGIATICAAVVNGIIAAIEKEERREK